MSLPNNRPALHTTPDGKLKLPIGTLDQQLQKAITRLPKSMSFNQAQCFAETLRRNPGFCREVAEILRGVQ